MKAVFVRPSALHARTGSRLSMCGQSALALLGCVTLAVFHPNESLGAGLSYVDYFRERVKRVPKEYSLF
jgi:hypothetical protein